MLTFSVAFGRWMTADDYEPFSPFADAALSHCRRVPPSWPSRPAVKGRFSCSYTLAGASPPCSAVAAQLASIFRLSAVGVPAAAV